jgi:hypothetical protein
MLDHCSIMNRIIDRHQPAPCPHRGGTSAAINS